MKNEISNFISIAYEIQDTSNDTENEFSTQHRQNTHDKNISNFVT